MTPDPPFNFEIGAPYSGGVFYSRLNHFTIGEYTHSVAGFRVNQNKLLWKFDIQ